jgi:DNA-binding transcriptional LysR family regulator
MTRKNHAAPPTPVVPLRAGFDELTAAEVFLQVVRTRGFTSAARSLGRSTSALSRIVSELERQLGAQLLARTTRRMSVTEAGAVYASHAEGLLAAQRAGRDAITELTGGVPRGHLRVSVPVAVGDRLLGQHLPAFRARFPELRLEIELSDRNALLVQGGFDLAIRVGRLADSSLRALLLATVPVHLVASPAYLAARGEPRHPDELRAHDCITVGAVAGPVEWTFHRRGQRRRAAGKAASKTANKAAGNDAIARVELDGVVHTTSAPFAARLATEGLGVVRALEWVIREPLRGGQLVEVMRDWACDLPGERGVPIYAVFAQTAGATPPLKSRVFVELIKEVLVTEGLARSKPR